MVTVSKKWRRWTGPTTELVRAIERASDTLASWSGIDSHIESTVVYKTGLTDQRNNVEVIEEIQKGNYSNVQEISVRVSQNLEIWYRHMSEAQQRGGTIDELPNARVSIRLSRYGTTLDVEGDERDRVEGLAQQLTETMSHFTTNSPWLDREPLPPAVFSISFVALIIVGLLAIRWFDFETQGGVTAAEVVVMVGAIAISIVFAVLLMWLFPPLELIGEGETSRLRKWRGKVIGSIGALILLAAGLIIDRML